MMSPRVRAELPALQHGFDARGHARHTHLATTRLEESSHAGKLFSAAYYRLLTGDAVAARPLIERALKAADAR
jgi:hypothetical protein